jgi:hypothetical protein
MRAFPEREGGNERNFAPAAWARALERGADPERIITAALAYATATEGRPRRYIMGVRRWLNEARWREAVFLEIGEKPRLVWIEYGSPEWWPWSNHWRETRGKTPPTDVKGGWRFPSQYPPAPLEQAA